MSDYSSGNTNTTLWREAWLACMRSWGDLLPWIFGFSLLLTLCNFYIMRDEIYTMQNAMSSAQNAAGLEGLSSLLSSSGEVPVVRAATICSDIISFIAFYYFTVLYLKREPLTPNSVRPELSPSGFGHWLVPVIKAVLCILGVALAIGGVGYLLGLLTRSSEGVSDIITMAASIAVMIVVIYMGIRFLLVSPLTLSGVEPSVTISWQMTRHHWWRLLWGYFCIGWSVFVVFAVAFLVLVALVLLTGSPLDSAFFISGLSFLGALYSVVNLAMSCIYFCVACRILMAEKQEKITLPTQGIV